MDKHTKENTVFHRGKKMKVYKNHNGFLMTGKVWEIREYLKLQKRHYSSVIEFCSEVIYQSTAPKIPKKNKGSSAIVRPIVVIRIGDKS